MSLSRKRKKELRKLQREASSIWVAQQELLGEAGGLARQAGRQLGNYSREQIAPAINANYQRYGAPALERSRRALNNAAAAVVGSALSVMDAAEITRAKIGAKTGNPKYVVPVKKRGIGAGGVVAIIAGAAVTAAVAYAAWQTLRTDDELWVADDPSDDAASTDA